MEWRSVAALGLGATAVALGVACGDGEAKPPRGVTAEDLPAMVLQQEDVPAALERVEEDNRELGFVEPEYDPRAESMFLRQFELPSGEVAAGGAVCIRTSALLYASPKDAKDTWDELQEIEDLFYEEGAGSSLTTEELTLPDLGDASIGYGPVEPTEIPCESYQGQSGGSHHIFFRRWNIVAGLIVYWSESDQPSDQAISLAQKQAGRIEALLEEEPHDR